MSRSSRFSLIAAGLVGLAAALGAAAPAAAQGSGVVAGTVVDSTTRRPIEGAQVVVAGTTRGTITNSEGVWVLRGVPAGTARVRVLRIGYGSQTRAVTIAANDSVAVDFALRAVAQQLSEVVVTGYGTASRRDVSSAVSTVRGEEIANQPVAGVDAALQGKAPGVQVIQNAGNPGNGISIRVRGSSSLSASNQPLYVIDGMPLIREDLSQLDFGGQDLTAVTGLSPDEIASIDILKDAAAAAIYGSRASNGVIMITTKRGQAGRTQIGFNVYTGWQQREKRVDMMNGHEYVDFMYEAVLQDCRYTDIYEGETCDDALAESELGFGRDIANQFNTDWQGEIFRTAPVRDFSLNASGGTDRLQFFLSGSHFDQRGIVIGSKYNRQNLRANADFRVNNRLQLRSSMGLVREDNDRNENDNTLDGVVTNAIASEPIVPVRVEGRFATTDDGLTYTNPVAIGTLDAAESRTFRALGNIEAEYNFTQSFRLNARAGADVLNLRDLRWFSPEIIGRYAATVSGIAQQGNNTATRYLLESFGTFDRPFGAGRLALTGGGSVEWNERELDFLQGEGFGSERFRYPGNAGKITVYDGDKTGHNLVSLFSRANVAFMDRYFLTASLRTDGSSRFGENNRYGVFPAASVGWAISDEPFLSGLSRFGDLKLRVSYGVTGNQGIGDDFAALARFGKANYGDEPGIGPNAIGNADLRWETTREFDVGLDLSVLDGRVGIIGDYYRKKTEDLLVLRPITRTSGFTSFWDNVGNIENRGYELQVTTENVRPRATDGFRWSSDLNISWNRNEVTKLFRGEPFSTGFRSVNRVAEGVPIGAFYTLRFQGVDPATGDAIYKDINGDGAFTAADREIVGSPHPTYWGGFTNTVGWRGFDVRAFFQFSHGAEVYNAMRIFSGDGGYNTDNKFRDQFRRWQQPGDESDVPRLSWWGSSNGQLVSSRFIEDGSYVRFQELQVGYRLPVAFSRYAQMREARIWVAGRNLKTWTDYTGYSPELNSFGSSANTSLGTDFYAYPLARTWTVGITGSF